MAAPGNADPQKEPLIPAARPPNPLAGGVAPPPNPLTMGVRPNPSEEVTKEGIRKTSKQSPGLGFPGTPTMTPITSPEMRRRPYKTMSSQDKSLELQVTIACVIMFAEGFYATQVFPYVSFMVEELRGNSLQLGVYTGLFYTSQSFGMLMSASIWAKLSNRFGRRKCQLACLCFACCTSILVAVSSEYWFTSAIRLLGGVLNNNLSIARTALREAHQRAQKPDTGAFSILSVAFGASCVAGPSLGGILYGMLPDGQFGLSRAWTAPMLVSAGLYIVGLLVTFFWMKETADLEKLRIHRQVSQELGTTNADPLWKKRDFILIMLMVGGHSYCFTGWELAYPLLARTKAEDGGEGWNTKQIGVTFLVGSIGLMMWSLVVYPKLATRIRLHKLWQMLWTPPILVMPLFARALPLLLESGFGPHSMTVLLVNYAAQLTISVLIGCQFISTQLIINQYVAQLKDGEALLAMANGYCVSTQAVSRAVSPLTTGFLFTFGKKQQESGSLLLSQATTFDHLSLVGFFFCFLAAWAYLALQNK